MAKWADYLISQVSYDSNHRITKVKQHKDNGNKISEGEVVDRNTVTGNLGHGAKYMTMFGDLGKIRIGKNVRYFRAYEHHYIRIDNNKVIESLHILNKNNNKVTTTKKLMDKKQLSTLKIYALVLNHTKDSRHYVHDKKYHEEMSFLVSHTPRNKFIRNLCLNLQGNTLCLFTLVEKHGKLLLDMIKKKAEKNRKVFFVYGGVEALDREKIRSIVEKEDNAIIVASYGTFSTGINIRNLHNIVFSSPTKSKIRSLQSIGRGLRIGDNKTKATLYDIADDLTYNEKKNYTLEHFSNRINIYNEEDFNYEIHQVELKN